MSFHNVFSNKTVLITGHTGFKGAWLIAWLRKLGAIVVGLGLEPETSPSHFVVANLGNDIKDIRLDIRNASDLELAIISAQPDFVFHLAAQSLVKASYSDPIDTWQTNVLGTVNLLNALRMLKKSCVAIFITSDKCYENKEWIWGYREIDRLGGVDPYSSSKAAAEVAISSFVRSYFFSKSQPVAIASARAGNVIGGGDWSQDRIVPDCVRAWSIGNSVPIRSPNSTRPWQHVLEPLSGYLSLASSLSISNQLNGESFNFGPSSSENFSVIDLVREMGKGWDKVSYEMKEVLSEHHEANLLRLNCDKAKTYLDWFPTLNFHEAVRFTAEWYKNYYENKGSVIDLTNLQIGNYVALAKERGALWAI